MVEYQTIKTPGVYIDVIMVNHRDYRELEAIELPEFGIIIGG